MLGVMPKLDQLSGQARICWRIAIGCLIAFAVMDLFPRHGAPDFRYTGSDPAYHVWNLGWPLALAIYDSRSGIHIGPFLYVVVPVQAVVVSLIAAAAFVFRKRHNPALQTTAAPPCC
jgi:hypothetical protein